MEHSSITSYLDAHDPKYGEPHPVPLKIATEENLKEYGRFVDNFENEDVWIVTWPLQGWRKMSPGTGNQGGVVEGDFVFRWEGDMLKATNLAVDRHYITGRLPKGAKDRSHVLVRDLNYHPDGGQVFSSTDGKPFVMLLALPGDDVKLEDFVAFYFDGTRGVQIKPNIWHQSAYPVEEEAAFKNKQGRVHGCVDVDCATEFGKYLKVPLQRSLAVLE